MGESKGVKAEKQAEAKNLYRQSALQTLSPELGGPGSVGGGMALGVRLVESDWT